MQKTCGKDCRRKRRTKQEKARRDEDLAAARARERGRKRKQRAKVGRGQPMSLAGLPAEVAAEIDELFDSVRHGLDVSLAGLRRRLRQLSLGQKAPAGVGPGT